MIENIKYLVLLTSFSFLISCGDQSVEDTTETNIEEPAPAATEPECSFTLGDDATSVYWTAFKHTAKLEVKGQMDSIVVTNTATATSVMDALTGAQVQIFTSSINSKDEVRDKKLREIYFGSMSNTEPIVGNLISSEGTGTEGTCTFSLTMNDFEQTVTGEYIVEDATVQIRFTIEPNQWGAQEAITKLGEACAEKHTGEDGETVFWPDVDLLIEVALTKDCPDAA